jgi:8-oxo-dGTP pyrophosphatase MutT (NUDIX family)
MIVKKAGCILVNFDNKMIGLVYRYKRKDYSFPKGHLEEGETLEECAVRETEEETGRACSIIKTKELPLLKYVDSVGDEVECYNYFAKDEGPSSRTISPNDKEELIWKSIEDVENTLSYQNLKDLWNEIKPILDSLIEK